MCSPCFLSSGLQLGQWSTKIFSCQVRSFDGLQWHHWRWNAGSGWYRQSTAVLDFWSLCLLCQHWVVQSWFLEGGKSWGGEEVWVQLEEAKPACVSEDSIAGEASSSPRIYQQRYWFLCGKDGWEGGDVQWGYAVLEWMFGRVSCN